MLFWKDVLTFPDLQHESTLDINGSPFLVLWPQVKKGHQELEDDTNGFWGFISLKGFLFRYFDGPGEMHKEAHLSHLYTQSVRWRSTGPPRPQLSPSSSSSTAPQYTVRTVLSTGGAFHHQRLPVSWDILFCFTLHWQRGATCRAKMNICSTFLRALVYFYECFKPFIWKENTLLNHM